VIALRQPQLREDRSSSATERVAPASISPTPPGQDASSAHEPPRSDPSRVKPESAPVRPSEARSRIVWGLSFRFVRNLRKRSIAQLAAQTGLAVRTLERIESGTHDTTATQMWALSQALQFPVSAVTRIAEVILEVTDTPETPAKHTSPRNVPQRHRHPAKVRGSQVSASKTGVSSLRPPPAPKPSQIRTRPKGRRGSR
jgi:transcriptional regulator with XRE-family HTH domain